MSIYDQAREASKLLRGEDHERAKGYVILVNIWEPLANAYVDKCDEHEALKKRLAALADELEEEADDLGEGGGYEYRDAAARIREVIERDKS